MSQWRRITHPTRLSQLAWPNPTHSHSPDRVNRNVVQKASAKKKKKTAATACCMNKLVWGSYLDDGTLGHDTKRSIHGTIWVLLHTNNLEIECAFKFRVRNMGFIEPQTWGAYETFIFGRLPGKSLSHKGDFCHHPLPLLGWKSNIPENQKCKHAIILKCLT